MIAYIPDIYFIHSPQDFKFTTKKIIFYKNNEFESLLTPRDN